MAGKKIGILAMQGAFVEHQRMLEKCGARASQVRTGGELDAVEALIIPGGESTTIGKLLALHGLGEAIRQRAGDGMPIWGTCAGMILLAREIEGLSPYSLGLMDIAVVRNGFGRQVDSFEAWLDIDGIGRKAGIFIRAPYVERVWGGARVMATLEGRIVMAEQGGQYLATAFHPELGDDLDIHRYFIEMMK